MRTPCPKRISVRCRNRRHHAIHPTSRSRRHRAHRRGSGGDPRGTDLPGLVVHGPFRNRCGRAQRADRVDAVRSAVRARPRVPHQGPAGGTVGTARRSAGPGTRHDRGRTDRGPASDRGAHVPRRAGPGRGLAAQLRTAQPAERTAARVARASWTRPGARTSTASSPTCCGWRTARCSPSSRRSARAPATPWSAPSPTTRTQPSSTTSRSWRPRGTSTSTPSPRTWPPRAPRRSPTPRPRPARRPPPRPPCR